MLAEVKGPSDFPNDFSTHDIYAMNVLGEELSEMNPPGSPRLLGAIATSYMRLLKHELLYHGVFTVRGVFTMRPSAALIKFDLRVSLYKPAFLYYKHHVRKRVLGE